MSFHERYQCVKNGKTIDKEVVYFPAQVSGEVQLQKEEIIAGGWFEIDKALNTITYLASKNTCLALRRAILEKKICL